MIDFRYKIGVLFLQQNTYIFLLITIKKVLYLCTRKHSSLLSYTLYQSTSYYLHNFNDMTAFNHISKTKA